MALLRGLPQSTISVRLTGNGAHCVRTVNLFYSCNPPNPVVVFGCSCLRCCSAKLLPSTILFHFCLLSGPVPFSGPSGAQLCKAMALSSDWCCTLQELWGQVSEYEVNGRVNIYGAAAFQLPRVPEHPLTAPPPPSPLFFG